MVTVGTVRVCVVIESVGVCVMGECGGYVVCVCVCVCVVSDVLCVCCSCVR